MDILRHSDKDDPLRRDDTRYHVVLLGELLEFLPESNIPILLAFCRIGDKVKGITVILFLVLADVANSLVNGTLHRPDSCRASRPFLACPAVGGDDALESLITAGDIVCAEYSPVS